MRVSFKASLGARKTFDLIAEHPCRSSATSNLRRRASRMSNLHDGSRIGDEKKLDD